jgi:hypothetical protein
MNLEEAIQHSVYYQDLEILNKIFNNFFDKDLTLINQEVSQEFKNDLKLLNEISIEDSTIINLEVLQKNDLVFLNAITNETVRRFLEKENKHDEYMKIYIEKIIESKNTENNDYIKVNQKIPENK